MSWRSCGNENFQRISPSRVFSFRYLSKLPESLPPPTVINDQRTTETRMTTVAVCRGEMHLIALASIYNWYHRAVEHFVVVLPSINDEINGKPCWIRIIQQRRVAIFETRIDCRQSRINGTAAGSQVLRMTSHVIARNCARYTTRGAWPRSISINPVRASKVDFYARAVHRTSRG